MRMLVREALKTLASGVAVYLIVASCSPSGVSSPLSGLDGSVGVVTTETGGAPTETPDSSLGAGGLLASSGGRSSTGGASMFDAAVGRMMKPVPDAHADTYQSGTRIRAKYLIGTDGSKQFQGWHDSQRNEDCEFVTATDGATRCLPLLGVAAAYAGSYYSDSGCSQRVAETTAPNGCVAQPTKYVYTAATSGCPPVSGYAIAAIGVEYTGDVYAGTPASCTKLPATSLSGDTFYSVGVAIDPSEFVSATVIVE